VDSDSILLTALEILAVSMENSGMLSKNLMGRKTEGVGMRVALVLKIDFYFFLNQQFIRRSARADRGSYVITTYKRSRHTWGRKRKEKKEKGKKIFKGERKKKKKRKTKSESKHI